MPSATKAAKKQLTSRLLPIFAGHRHLHAHYKKIAEIKASVRIPSLGSGLCSPTTEGKKEGENHYDEDARSLV